MVAYDFLHDYPVIEIYLEKDQRRVKAVTIVDTGSPYSILSKKALSDLNLLEQEVTMEVKIHGVIHKEECEALAPAYLLNLIIDNRKIKDILVVEYDFHSTIGLLGHNILKNFELTINWKERTIELK